MKKNLLIGLLLIAIGVVGFIVIRGMGNPGLAFKTDYEEINGKENAHGKVHRVVTINEENPFVETTSADVLKKIENGETFYVYFGSRLCPWCRSSIEKAIEVASTHGVKKIYYVDIWDDEGNEIVRDKYSLNDKNELEKLKDGDESYAKLLEKFESLLSDYTLTTSDGKKVEVGEKRIYAPNYIYIEKGVAKKLTTGVSDKQKDSREELTAEMLKDEETQFNDFFSEVCDDAC